MNYLIKITHVSDDCVPDINFVRDEKAQIIYYPSVNHASAVCLEMIKHGDQYGMIEHQKSYFYSQGENTIIFEIIPHLEQTLPTLFKDKRGREWETYIDKSYYDMVCVRWTSDKSFNNPLSFHFNTTAQACLFVQLLKEAY